jgi:hypothetical protein
MLPTLRKSGSASSGRQSVDAVNRSGPLVHDAPRNAPAMRPSTCFNLAISLKEQGISMTFLLASARRRHRRVAAFHAFTAFEASEFSDISPIRRFRADMAPAPIKL